MCQVTGTTQTMAISIHTLTYGIFLDLPSAFCRPHRHPLWPHILSGLHEQLSESEPDVSLGSKTSHGHELLTLKSCTQKVKSTDL